MFKLALNAGHGYETAGKRTLKAIDPNETREYVLNKRICDKLEARLSLYEGIEILRLDNGSDTPISQRTKRANDWGADFYLSVHHNAGILGGAGGGIEAYVYLTVDNVTLQWQKALYDEAVRLTLLKGNRSNGLRKADFAELRETKMPAVLMECGFMDSVVDTPIILTDDFAEKMATAFALVIVERAGLEKKSTSVGWIKDNIGWWYRRADGSYPKSEWLKLGDEWFYFDAVGYAVKENTWLKLGGRWYYFNERNAAARGLQNINGALYYFSENTTADLYECQLIITDPSGQIKATT